MDPASKMMRAGTTPEGGAVFLGRETPNRALRG